MSDPSEIDLTFRSTAEVDAFCRWYLRQNVSNIKDEFQDDGERKEFLRRRERKLKSTLDDLSQLSFDTAITCPIEKIKYYRIVKSVYKNPLSSIGSDIKNSRFNYKNVDLFNNRVIYFGQTLQCCEAELFHLDIQKSNYAKLIGRTPQESKDELPWAKHSFYEFEIYLDNILVLTTDSSIKAVNIPVGVAKDEWYSLNDEYEIPTSGQILGALAKKRGYKGILYTSVRFQTAYNLVIFEENSGPLKLGPVRHGPFEGTLSSM